MKNLTIPPAPVDAARPQSQTPAKAGAPMSPLEPAFIGRIYRSMLWFGAVCTLLAAFALKGDGAGIGSFAGGLVLAAVLLRSQEVSVRSLLQPKEKMLGMDARLAMVLLLPFKFVAVVLALVVFNGLDLLRPALLALGFTAGMLVLVAKFAGWWLMRLRSN